VDDLEEIWGPRGRATVDPGSVRAVPRPDPAGAAVPAPLSPAPPLLPPAPWSPAAPIDAGEFVPAGASTSQPRPVAAIAAGAVALVVVVVAVVLASRPSDRPAPIVAGGGSTATTIVSAAADLLGRSTTTVPSEVTTTSVGLLSSTTPAAPTTVVAIPTTAAAATPSRPAPASTAGLPPLAQAEDAARQFIDILHRRDCDGLWSMLSRGTQAFLTGSAEPGEASGRDALCDGLRTEETIPPMRVHGPAEWRGAGAAVPLESEGEVEELAFVAEDGRWVIDLFGDFNEES
jgi:hypothetical protein